MREFPTDYYSRFGLRQKVPLKLLAVTRNGEAEPVRVQSLRNGVRLLIGDPAYTLPEGEYRYMIRFETYRQLIAREGMHELYWNVNGTGWRLPTVAVRCRIRLPEAVRIQLSDAYTGAMGSKGKAFTFERASDQSLEFRTTLPLKPMEGLTVALAFTGGTFPELPLWRICLQLIQDNAVPAGMAGFVLIQFLSFFFAWYRFGRDPQKGTIIPRFEPPQGLSAPETGYVLEQAYHPRILASALLEMSVNQRLSIAMETKGTLFKRTVYTFQALPDEQEGATEDIRRFGFESEDLAGETAQKGEYNKAVAEASRALERTLKDRFQKPAAFLFRRNDTYSGLGILGLVFAGIAGGVWAALFHPPASAFILMLGILLCGILVQAVFLWLMKAYSAEGRRKADEAEGFKMYLNTAERLVYDQLNPPEENLQLYEKYLPYAVALGVENRWAERFRDQLNTLQATSAGNVYHGLRGSMAVSSLGSDLSGLSNTVASASSPPSQSSEGSSGGGFSGGGGGGGGGGGW